MVDRIASKQTGGPSPSLVKATSTPTPKPTPGQAPAPTPDELKLSTSGQAITASMLEKHTTAAFTPSSTPSGKDDDHEKPVFPNGGFKVSDLRETFNHLNGTNDPNGIKIEVVGQHPHHGELAKAYEAYAEDVRFDATRRADAAKFAQSENKRANELRFLADTVFIAQKDGNSKMLTFKEVKSLDLNHDGSIMQDEVATVRARYQPLTAPDVEPAPAKKPDLKPGELDLNAVQKTLYQIDNKTRSGKVTPDMIEKAVDTSEKKLRILNDIIDDPILGKQFSGPHSVKEAIDREKGTVKNGQFLLKDFSRIAPQDTAPLMKDILRDVQKDSPQPPNPATLMKDMQRLFQKSMTISANDLKLLASKDDDKTVISPKDLDRSSPEDFMNMWMNFFSQFLQSLQSRRYSRAHNK